MARRCSSSWTIRASLAFWAARTLALGCFLRATLALHSGERFVRARSFRDARPVVRVDEEHGHQPFLAGSRALPIPATVRSSTREWACSPCDAQSRSRDLFSRSALLRSPCSLLRANTSLRTIRGPSGARVRSSYGLSMTITFWAIALLRTVVRLSLFFASWGEDDRNLAITFWDLALLHSSSPRRARTKPFDPARARARHSHAKRLLKADCMCSRCSLLRSPILRLRNSSASWSTLGARL